MSDGDKAAITASKYEATHKAEAFSSHKTLSQGNGFSGLTLFS